MNTKTFISRLYSSNLKRLIHFRYIRPFSGITGKPDIETTIVKSLSDPYMINPGAILFPGARNFAKVTGTTFIEIWCGNAKQSSMYYQQSFGFILFAYKGLETGSTDRASYVLKQNDITLVLTSPLTSSGDIIDHVSRHGDGVKYIALTTSDATAAYHETLERGAKSAIPPYTLTDTHGSVVISGIHIYGDTEHLFIQKNNYSGLFMPGYVGMSSNVVGAVGTGLNYIDHIVGNVGWGEMDRWADFYKKVFGMDQLISFDDKDIRTDYTCLKSKVVTIDTGMIKYPINEPAKGLKVSQVEEFINFYKSPGVQHIALSTFDIIKTVNDLRNRGVEFISIPSTYYSSLTSRVGEIQEDISVLESLGILVDCDDGGYLLQIFTKPLTDRPTMFFEIIQRKGGFSFGKGNFQALFLSIEEEQRKRGTLVDSV